MSATHNDLWGTAMTGTNTTTASAQGAPTEGQLPGSGSDCRGPSNGRGRDGARSLMGRAVLVAAALIAGVLALAGCSTPPTATPSSSTGAATSAPVESTAPPPTTVAPAVYRPATDQGPAENVPVPVLPDKAKEFSKEGLMAFTEYWYSTLGYAFETGDSQPMLDISSPSCEMCETMKETVVPWHEEGRWIVGGQMTVLDTSATFSPTKDGNYQVTALVRQNHLQFYRADKTISKDLGQEPSVADVLVAVHDSGRWSAVEIGRLDGSPS